MTSGFGLDLVNLSRWSSLSWKYYYLQMANRLCKRGQWSGRVLCLHSIKQIVSSNFLFHAQTTNLCSTAWSREHRLALFPSKRVRLMCAVKLVQNRLIGSGEPKFLSNLRASLYKRIISSFCRQHKIMRRLFLILSLCLSASFGFIRPTIQ